MAVTYTKEQRLAAKEHGLFLCTLAVPGLEVQAPFDAEETKRISDFIDDMLARRREWLKRQRENKLTRL